MEQMHAATVMAKSCRNKDKWAVGCHVSHTCLLPFPGLEALRSMVLQGFSQTGSSTAHAYKEDQAPAGCW